MVKKKRGKGKKLARLNDEERARYMQRRAELELETKRRKQQLIAIFTKNKLAHEEAFTKINNAKINEKWRYFLRQIKCKELHESVAHLSKYFERVMKIKDVTISYLCEELTIAEKDHKRLQEYHATLIGKNIGRYKQWLKQLQDTNKFHDLKVKNSNELIELKNQMERSCLQLSRIIAEKNAVFNEEYTIKKTQNAVNMFSILYMEEDTASHLVHDSFEKMENVWRQLNKVINDYEEQIDSKKKQHDYVKDQDDIYQASMAQYPKLHMQLQKDIDTFKNNIEILSCQREEHLRMLKREDEDLEKKLKTMKQEFIVNQVTDSSHLKHLTTTSNETLKHLHAIVEKGFTILEFIKICSSLEPTSFSLKKYLIQDAKHFDLTDQNIPISCAITNHFWEHYNSVKADNVLLKKVNDRLHIENEHLKENLQTYLRLDFGKLALYPVSSPLI